ncbi:MAG: L-arabinose isomerase [Bacteroidales bacterium]|nr:L-arabinose isomerase [Bacteroidales bacterium]MCB8999867.1 L-arabinose isomerase [Bacteroidales bacterium]
MDTLKKFEVWFVTGSQDLYGDETLKQVAIDSEHIAKELNNSAEIPVNVVFKPVLKSSGEILSLCMEVNNSVNCIGIIAWMHTFSPAKMWINGLKILNKPLAHLHTQFNRDIPWDSIDMDFMNLNQSAHGDREFGFIVSRMRMNRKVIVGHWKETDVRMKIASWARAACGWHDWQGMKVARFGDNMREVAVTEGDKVEAQLRLGYSVNGYGVGDLVDSINRVNQKEIDDLIGIYKAEYQVSPDIFKPGAKLDSLKESARIEAGLRSFLKNGGFKAFTTTFEDLHGLKQLPGLAVQRLMADGYGFGAEGDWKTSALVRAMKVMSTGLVGGTSFMEDYTYHLDPKGMKVLGAHMLEVCPSIGRGKASLEIHPLGIGGKDDPARLVFNVPEGKGINVSVMDMGDRFRMLANPCRVVNPEASLPKLPVARVVWIPEPDLKTSAEAWIHAGGAHHTGFSMAIGVEEMENFAEMAGMEFMLIDKDTKIRDFKNALRWNDLYFQLKR